MLERNNNFTCIHLCAALMVVLGHQFDLMGKTPPSIFGMNVHGLGVRILFVVSGYLITESYIRNNNIFVYIKRRLLRIYPALIICIMMSVLALGPIFTTLPLSIYFKNSGEYIWKNLCMSPVFALPGVFEDNIYPSVVNGSLWTLPIEVFCYLTLIVFLGIYNKLSLLSRKGANIYYIVVIVFLNVIYLLRMGGINESFIFWGTDWSMALELILYFYSGSLFSRLELKKSCNLQFALMVCLVTLCTGGLWRKITTILAIAYIVLSFAFAERLVFSKILKGKDICYGIYLWAFPVQQSLVQLILVRNGLECPVGIMFVFSIVIVFFLSYVTFVLVERPVQKRFK